MTDGEFLTQTIIERMDLIFRRSNKEPSEEEKAERQEREAQFRRILDSLPEDDRELLKGMQTEAFRRAARENELYYREGLKDGFTVCRFVNGG